MSKKYLKIGLTVAVILFLGSAVKTQAQVPELIKNEAFRKDAAAAVDSLYNFNAIASEERLAKWKEEYPHHPLWALFDAMTMWWMVLSDLENHAYDKHLLRLMKQADYQASKLLHEQRGHVDGLIIKAIANGYIARHFANRGEWLTSIRYGRTAIKAYEYLQNAMPELADLKLAKGIKLYYAAYLPKAYPIVKTVSWFMPDGNMPKGLKLLKQASKQAIFAGAEATYFLGNIYFNYEHKPAEAIKYFEQLHLAYPNNNYYARLLVHNYYKIERYDDALNTIVAVLERWKQKELPFQKVVKQELFYWKGRILMRRSDVKQAADLFIQSFELAKQLPRTQHRSYYTAAAYYAGKALLFMDDKQKAAYYLKAAVKSETGEGFRDSAQQLLERLN